MCCCTDLLSHQCRYEVLWPAPFKVFDYCKKLTRTITGGVPDKLFVKSDGSLKREESVVNRLVMISGQSTGAVLCARTSLRQLNAVRRTNAHQSERHRRPDSYLPDCRYK